MNHDWETHHCLYSLAHIRMCCPNTVFFRGRPSNVVRTAMMDRAREHPTALDVRVTKNQFNYFPNDDARREHAEYERKHGPKADLIKMASFFKSKSASPARCVVANGFLQARGGGGSSVPWILNLIILACERIQTYALAMSRDAHFITQVPAEH